VDDQVGGPQDLQARSGQPAVAARQVCVGDQSELNL
jgi:hypothetical protein